MKKCTMNMNSLYDGLMELRIKARIQEEKSFYMILYYKDSLKNPKRSIKLKRQESKYLEARTVLNGINSTIRFLSQIENTRNL